MIEEDDEKCPEGMIRVYLDHTGRTYEDYTPEEYDKLYNYELHKLMREFRQKEIDDEMVKTLRKVHDQNTGITLKHTVDWSNVLAIIGVKQDEKGNFKATPVYTLAQIHGRNMDFIVWMREFNEQERSEYVNRFVPTFRSRRNGKEIFSHKLNENEKSIRSDNA
jgi:hypothetical protein